MTRSPLKQTSLLLLLLWSVFAPSSLSASDVSEIRNVWERMVREAQVRSHYDLQTFYQEALQDHWSLWSEAAKADFGRHFEGLFLERMSRQFSRMSQLGERDIAGKTRIFGDRAVAEFVRKKEDREIHFKLYCKKTGDSWKIYDLDVEGALLSRNYRAQFNKILRNEGFKGLLAKLDQKLTKERGAL